MNDFQKVLSAYEKRLNDLEKQYDKCKNEVLKSLLLNSTTLLHASLDVYTDFVMTVYDKTDDSASDIALLQKIIANESAINNISDPKLRQAFANINKSQQSTSWLIVHTKLLLRTLDDQSIQRLTDAIVELFEGTDFTDEIKAGLLAIYRTALGLIPGVGDLVSGLTEIKKFLNRTMERLIAADAFLQSLDETSKAYLEFATFVELMIEMRARPPKEISSNADLFLTEERIETISVALRKRVEKFR